MSSIVVTGASGFIGTHLTRSLAAAGHQVIALSRSSENLPDIHPAIWQKIDSYENTTQLTKRLIGAELVIHLADEPNRMANGTSPGSSLANAITYSMRQAGTKRVVMSSSIYARLAASGQKSGYGSAKLEAENIFLSAENIEPIILRLPPVYGPNNKGGFSTLVAAVAKGGKIPFGKATAPRSYLSLNNLTELMLVLADSNNASWNQINSKIYEPSDGNTVSTSELIKMIAGQMDRTPNVINLPIWCLNLIGVVTGKKEAIAAACQPLIAKNNDQLTSDFGWKPTETLPGSLKFLSTQY